MKKLSIKNIIEFRNKSDRAKKSFTNGLKFDSRNVTTESGGNYWIISLSAISNGFKFNDLQFIDEKIRELEEKFENSDFPRTKTMYERNRDILYNYEVFEFEKWTPSSEIKFLKKHKTEQILTIKGLQVQANPHHVFSFQIDDKEEIGAIWFVAKLGGYSKVELGMFTDIMYSYLNINFSDKYTVNPSYCIAVDVVNTFDVNYSQLLKGDIPLLLDSTIDEIKGILSA